MITANLLEVMEEFKVLYCPSNWFGLICFKIGWYMGMVYMLQLLLDVMLLQLLLEVVL